MEKNKSCKYPRNIPEIDEKGSRNWINSDKRAWLVHNFEPTNRFVFLEHCEEPWVCVDLDTGRTNSFFGEVILVYPKLAGPLRERIVAQAQALCYLACYVHNQAMELGSIRPDYFSEDYSSKQITVRYLCQCEQKLIWNRSHHHIRYRISPFKLGWVRI